MPGIDSSTQLMLHLNNSIVDSSQNAFAITNDDTVFTTPVVNFAGLGYTLFNGQNSYLSVPSNAAFNFGSGNFTIEAWINPSYISPQAGIAGNWNNTGNNEGWFFLLSNDSLGHLRFIYATTSSSSSLVDFVATGASITLNTWQHVAAVRNGSTLTLYLNGVSVGSESVGAASFYFPSQVITVGNSSTADSAWAGGMQESRISNIARWTTNFTPPTSEYTSDGNTVLLLHLNTNIDSSSNAFTVTNSNCDILPLSTYFPSLGFGAWDGQSSYLSIPTSSDFAFTGDFTIEFAINPSSLVFHQIIGDADIFHNSNSGWALMINSVNLQFIYLSSGSYVLNFSLTHGMSVGNSYHIAVVRSGTTITIYVNGVSIGSNTYSGTLSSSSALRIGTNAVTANYYLDAYMQEVRLSNIARWTTNFTPPTSEYTSDGNTVLLLHLNGNVTDSSSNAFTVTNTNVLFYTLGEFINKGYGVFTGLSYLITPTSSIFEFTGNFTFEGWFYLTELNGGENFLANQYHTLGINGNWAIEYESDNGQIYIDTWDGQSNDEKVVTSGATITTNQWYHIAVVRIGTTVNVYINGVSKGSGTITKTLGATSPVICVGSSPGGAGTNLFGNAQEVRISNIARWSTNFTPPTLEYTAGSGMFALVSR